MRLLGLGFRFWGSGFRDRRKERERESVCVCVCEREREIRVPGGEDGIVDRDPKRGYRGSSPIRNTFPPRITIDSQAQGYCRVLRGGGGSCERGTPVDPRGGTSKRTKGAASLREEAGQFRELDHAVHRSPEVASPLPPSHPLVSEGVEGKRTSGARSRWVDNASDTPNASATPLGEVHLARHKWPGVKWTTLTQTLARRAVPATALSGEFLAKVRFGEFCHGWVH